MQVAVKRDKPESVAADVLAVFLRQEKSLASKSAVAQLDVRLEGRIRDYLVRVVPGSDELLLGHAFLAVGGARVPVGWFALERLRVR